MAAPTLDKASLVSTNEFYSLLKSVDLSVQKLGPLIGWSPNQIYKWITKEEMPIDMLACIAHATGIPEHRFVR